ncbi:tRNA (adenosine(37)-N6)-dimethylallyltransferase MiaA [Candidatus Saccharibacteria bacterium]|nr:tRNA (adenosine(37)-N6)-dimethylallyltransferase MiaA [Candidatus Saccharibacteria bacterium]NCS82843.1 tRNA (adenosine(37)-N6)-dimethylallyltransferase MiaA [Candidatus Saccharibacteria bacterium]
MPNAQPLPLIVIVGPTASGKSSLAMEIASQYNGEIICSDSRTIYKGMDIGTAKPSREDRAKVPHWGLDIVEPGEQFSAADFQSYAKKKVEEIRSRGNIPLMVGGTGLYIDGVVYDYNFGQARPELREALSSLSDDDLKNYCVNNNIELPENDKNRRYVIRAIEQNGINSKRLSALIPNTLVVGIATNPEELKARIEARAEQLFANGVVQEAILLGEKYGWDSEAMTGNIYKLARKYLDGEFDEAELLQKFVTSDWRLAKKQRTWFKRNPDIHWGTPAELHAYLDNILSA